jgi:hypothetical protein
VITFWLSHSRSSITFSRRHSQCCTTTGMLRSLFTVDDLITHTGNSADHRPTKFSTATSPSAPLSRPASVLAAGESAWIFALLQLAGLARSVHCQHYVLGDMVLDKLHGAGQVVVVQWCASTPCRVAG